MGTKYDNIRANKPCFGTIFKREYGHVVIGHQPACECFYCDTEEQCKKQAKHNITSRKGVIIWH